MQIRICELCVFIESACVQFSRVWVCGGWPAEVSESAEVGSTGRGVLSSSMVLELRILEKEENAQQGAEGFLLHQKLEME